MVTPKQIIEKVHKLSQKEQYEMYARLLPRAMETNPMKEWRISMNPSLDDLKEVLQVLPPKDMKDLEDIYF